jgi:probable DNA repair protein
MIFESLCEHLTKGAVVITPNARLALTLTRRFNAAQTGEVWPSPNIVPLSTWLKTCWQTAQFSSTEPLPQLISDTEEACLWQTILKEKNPYSFALEQFANQVKSAWTHCHAWQINIDKSVFSYNEETLFFYEITKAFEKLTQKYQPQSTLMNSLIPLIQNKLVPLPPKLILAYFDEFTPLQSRFFSLIGDKKTRLSHFDERIKNNDISYSVFDDKNQETAGLIDWLKNALKKGRKNIAVVVPDLAVRRESLERSLLSHLPKQHINFSIGKPLIEFSFVTHAYALLKMKRRIVSINELHLMLMTSFISSGKEDSLRAKVYHSLLKTGENHFYFSHVLSKLKDTKLQHALNNFYFIETTGEHSLNHWSRLFKHCLEALEFPGPFPLSSEEYQTQDKFNEVLKTLCKLDTHLKPMTYEKALNWLSWLLTTTLFQPKANNEEIQVLGMLEALGLQFDSLWMMGLTQNKFPKQTAPSPFIPLALQQQHAMPHSSIEREYNYAKQALERLTQSAPTVILSCFQKEEEELDAPSHLLLDYPEVKRSSIPITKKNLLETYTPHYNISKYPATESLGGTFILKEQARCPFRAYARFRLKLNEPRRITEGLDELTRGILIHEALEYFWQAVQTQENLQSLPTDEYDKLIQKSIKHALQNQESSHPVTLTESFKALETHRLTLILNQWITCEKDRPPFEVDELETKRTLSLGPLNFSMRVDRIDTLATGEKIVIDYKTGNPSLNAWFSDRPDEPQLPLYSLTDDKIRALAYGILKTPDIKFKGVSEDDVEIKGIKKIDSFGEANFSAQRTLWHARLEAIATEYCEGHISATPINNSLCTSCTFKSLCGKLR